MSWDMLARKADFSSLATLGRPAPSASCSACSARSSPVPAGPGLLAPVETVEDDAQAEGLQIVMEGHHDRATFTALASRWMASMGT